jgi:hypothetical protein
LLSSRWVAPTIVSPFDERVLRLHSEVAEKSAARDRLSIERAELVTRRTRAQLTVTDARMFQERFLHAVRLDRADQARLRAQLAALQPQVETTRRDLEESGRSYTELVRSRSTAMRDARLIDLEGFLTVNHGLDQDAVTRLAVSQQEVELGRRLSEVDRELAALAAAAGPSDGGAALPFTTRVLLQVREVERARLEEQQALALEQTLDASLAQLDASIDRYDRLLTTLRSSPWLAAVDGNVAVAFVPYENLKHVHEGSPLYACSAGLFLCHRVGTAGRVFEGESTMKHPVHQSTLRGAMLQLELSEPGAARNSSLFVGGAPLLF